MNMFLVLDNAAGSFPNNLVVVTEDKKVAEDFVNDYTEYLKRVARKTKIQNDLILIKNRIAVPVKNKLFTDILDETKKLESKYGKYVSFDSDKLLSLEKYVYDSNVKYEQEMVLYENQCHEAIAEYFEQNPDAKAILDFVEPIRPYHSYTIVSVNVNNGIIV
jgi:hypothetical protein